MRRRSWTTISPQAPRHAPSAPPHVERQEAQASLLVTRPSPLLPLLLALPGRGLREFVCVWKETGVKEQVSQHTSTQLRWPNEAQVTVKTHSQHEQVHLHNTILS
jgi:hypothetical protein